MKRILFVDDESTILDGLRRMLRGHRDTWEMGFAIGGKEALAEFEKSPFDVVVSDMRMPGMDGAEFLRQVYQRWPQTVRFILSGYSDLDATMRAVPVAHQFLSKPCDPGVLFEAVNRACDLQTVLTNNILRKNVGQIKALPPLPGTYARLSKSLTDPEATTKDIAIILEHDSALCAKLLQIVNSSFFGLPRRVSGIANAVNYLGINMLRNLVLTTEVFSNLSGKLAIGFSAEKLQQHVLLTGAISRILFKDRFKSEDAFMGCLLHDVGKFVFAICMPEIYSKVLAQSECDEGMLSIEQKEFGITHPEVGAYLLGIWGLPYPIVEAVAYHHQPQKVKHTSFDVVDAVYVSNLLAHEIQGSKNSDGKHLDEAYLSTIGVANNLQEWRSKAAKIFSAEEVY